MAPLFFRQRRDSNRHKFKRNPNGFEPAFEMIQFQSFFWAKNFSDKNSTFEDLGTKYIIYSHNFCTLKWLEHFAEWQHIKK